MRYNAQIINSTGKTGRVISQAAKTAFVLLQSETHKQQATALNALWQQSMPAGCQLTVTPTIFPQDGQAGITIPASLLATRINTQTHCAGGAAYLHYKALLNAASNKLLKYRQLRLQEERLATEQDPITVGVNFIMLEIDRCFAYDGSCFNTQSQHLKALQLFLNKFATMEGAKTRRATMGDTAKELGQAINHLEQMAANLSACRRLEALMGQSLAAAKLALQLAIAIANPKKDVIASIKTAEANDLAQGCVQQKSGRIKLVTLDKQNPYYNKIIQVATMLTTIGLEGKQSQALAKQLKSAIPSNKTQLKKTIDYFKSKYRALLSYSCSSVCPLVLLNNTQAKAVNQDFPEIIDSSNHEITARLQHINALLNFSIFMISLAQLANLVSLHAKHHGDIAIYTEQSNTILLFALNALHQKAQHQLAMATPLIRHINQLKSELGTKKAFSQQLKVYAELTQSLQQLFTDSNKEALPKKISELKTLQKNPITKQRAEQNERKLCQLLYSLNNSLALNLPQIAVTRFQERQQGTEPPSAKKNLNYYHYAFDQLAQSDKLKASHLLKTMINFFNYLQTITINDKALSVSTNYSKLLVQLCIQDPYSKQKKLILTILKKIGCLTINDESNSSYLKAIISQLTVLNNIKSLVITQQQHKACFYHHSLSELDSKAYRQLEIPWNNSSSLWAVSLAVLFNALTETPQAFNHCCNQLFRYTNCEFKQSDRVKALLESYQGNPIHLQHSILNDLITNNLRRKLSHHLQLHANRFAKLIQTGSINEYSQTLLDSSNWASDIELMALADLLAVRLIVFNQTIGPQVFEAEKVLNNFYFYQHNSHYYYFMPNEQLKQLSITTTVNPRFCMQERQVNTMTQQLIISCLSKKDKIALRKLQQMTTQLREYAHWLTQSTKQCEQQTFIQQQAESLQQQINRFKKQVTPITRLCSYQSLPWEINDDDLFKQYQEIIKLLLSDNWLHRLHYTQGLIQQLKKKFKLIIKNQHHLTRYCQLLDNLQHDIPIKLQIRNSKLNRKYRDIIGNIFSIKILSQRLINILSITDRKIDQDNVNTNLKLFDLHLKDAIKTLKKFGPKTSIMLFHATQAHYLEEKNNQLKQQVLSKINQLSDKHATQASDKKILQTIGENIKLGIAMYFSYETDFTTEKEVQTSFLQSNHKSKHKLYTLTSKNNAKPTIGTLKYIHRSCYPLGLIKSKFSLFLQFKEITHAMTNYMCLKIQRALIASKVNTASCNLSCIFDRLTLIISHFIPDDLTQCHWNLERGYIYIRNQINTLIKHHFADYVSSITSTPGKIIPRYQIHCKSILLQSNCFNELNTVINELMQFGLKIVSTIDPNVKKEAIKRQLKKRIHHYEQELNTLLTEHDHCLFFFAEPNTKKHANSEAEQRTRTYLFYANNLAQHTAAKEQKSALTQTRNCLIKKVNNE